MKAGANRSDINQILRMAKDGLDSGKISKRLNILENVVKGFMDYDPLAYEKKQAALAKQEAIKREEQQMIVEAGARIAVEEAKKKGKI